MKNKKIFYFIAIFIAIIAVSILLPNKANAATIKEDGEYDVIISSIYEYIYTNGKSTYVVSFDFDEGEEEVLVEDLVKDLDVFAYGRKVLGWKKSFDNSEKPTNITKLSKSDFDYCESGGVKSDKGFLLNPILEEYGPVNSGTSYLVINAFMGSINGKDIEVIKAPTSSFATVDLTKYVPTSTYSEYSFEGWSIDGKSYVKSISAEDFEKVPHDIIEVVGIWKKNTFDSNSSLNFRLDANGGTIDGETSKLFNFFVPRDSKDPYYLLAHNPKREGYKFTGWNTKADGTGSDVTTLIWGEVRDAESAGLDVDENKFLKLYATWEKTAETVTPAPTPEENKGTELSTKVENSEVEVKVELEKAVEKGSKLQIVKVAEEKVAEVKKIEKNLKAVFDINVVSNSGNIIKIEDNKMQIRILLEEDLRGYKNYQVVYIKDGKIVEEMPTKIEGNYIVFETTHLSEYGIIANNNEKVEEAQKPQTDNKETQEEANKTQNPQTGDNVVVFGIIFVVAVLGLAISTKYNSNKIK